MRVLAALAVLLTLSLSSAGALPAAAQQPLTSTTISGGDLPHGIRLAPVDHDAFMRRLDLPPLLDDEPDLKGRFYTVTSPYWDIGVRAGDNTQFVVEEVAIYYPEGGFVRTMQGGEAVWTALDSLQKAILNRYIRYAASLPEEPSVFDVLRAAGLGGESVGISIGSLDMTSDQRAKFWEASRDLTLQTRQTQANPLSTPAEGLTWIIFNLPEGRAVPMIYANQTGTFAELGESSSGRVFTVPRDWLVPVLGSDARFGAGSALSPVQVPQKDGNGSPIWWLIMIGGGLGAIAAGVLLERRLKHG